MIYSYCVNTFTTDGRFEPVQLNGFIEAESKLEAIANLILDGKVEPHGYEFLSLEEVE